MFNLKLKNAHQRMQFSHINNSRQGQFQQILMVKLNQRYGSVGRYRLGNLNEQWEKKNIYILWLACVVVVKWYSKATKHLFFWCIEHTDVHKISSFKLMKFPKYLEHFTELMFHLQTIKHSSWSFEKGTRTSQQENFSFSHMGFKGFDQNVFIALKKM